MSFGRTVLAFVVTLALGFGPSLATAAMLPGLNASSAAPALDDQLDDASDDSVQEHDGPAEPLSDGTPTGLQPLPEEEEEKHVSTTSSGVLLASISLHHDVTDGSPQRWPDGLKRPPRAER